MAWMDSRYNGRCVQHDCRAKIEQGDPIYYNSDGAHCGECGIEAEAEDLKAKARSGERAKLR